MKGELKYLNNKVNLMLALNSPLLFAVLALLWWSFLPDRTDFPFGIRVQPGLYPTLNLRPTNCFEHLNFVTRQATYSVIRGFRDMHRSVAPNAKAAGNSGTHQSVGLRCHFPATGVL